MCHHAAGCVTELDPLPLDFHRAHRAVLHQSVRTPCGHRLHHVLQRLGQMLKTLRELEAAPHQADNSGIALGKRDQQLRGRRWNRRHQTRRLAGPGPRRPLQPVGDTHPVLHHMPPLQPNLPRGAGRGWAPQATGSQVLDAAALDARKQPGQQLIPLDGGHPPGIRGGLKVLKVVRKARSGETFQVLLHWGELNPIRNGAQAL
mmetsp:Transcript_66453/g.152171  ORF Transcript_66453/g.152171 Transcript_66453/m.152171 type:complete len:203 (+) Transcript_66453:2699-3307(+)